jgi:predicted MFS family arabinose efflux permease
VGEGWCFLLDAVSYLAVIASLLAMRLPARERGRRGTDLWTELVSGVTYVRRFAPVRTVLLLLAIVSTMGMPYVVLMPAIASGVLHRGADALGFLMAATGVGALGGALYLASRRSVIGLGRVIALAAVTFGAGLVAFGLSRQYWFSLALLPVVGGGFMITMAATNTFLQTIVEEELRGRLMAFYTMAFLGTAPVGSLVAGVLAERIGPAATVVAGGVACLGAGGWFLVRLPVLRPLVRSVYAERGLLPIADVDAGM